MPGSCILPEGMAINGRLYHLPSSWGFSYRLVGYVPLPDRLPMSIAVGKNAYNLRPILEGIECVIVPSDRSSEKLEVRCAWIFSLGYQLNTMKPVCVCVQIFMYTSVLAYPIPCKALHTHYWVRPVKLLVPQLHMGNKKVHVNSTGKEICFWTCTACLHNIDWLYQL